MGRGGDETVINLEDTVRSGLSDSYGDLALADMARQLQELEAKLAQSEARSEDLREAAGHAVTTCRAWREEKHDRCNEPAEFLLWGKLFPPEVLGPCCYRCATEAGISDSTLNTKSASAILNLLQFRKALGLEA